MGFVILLVLQMKDQTPARAQLLGGGSPNCLVCRDCSGPVQVGRREGSRLGQLMKQSFWKVSLRNSGSCRASAKGICFRLLMNIIGVRGGVC